MRTKRPLQTVLKMISFLSQQSAVKLTGVVATVLLAGSLTASGLPIVYQGTFTQRVTDTDDTGLYQVGNTFTGYYRYSAPSMDGSFATNTGGYLGWGNWTNYTLDGSVFMPFSKETSFTLDGTIVEYFYGPGGSRVGLTETLNGGVLTIQSNNLTAFSWSYDYGGFYFGMVVGANGIGSFAALSYYDTGGAKITKGTVQFSNPTPVPDSINTSVCLAVAMVGLAVLKLLFRSVAIADASRLLTRQIAEPESVASRSMGPSSEILRGIEL